MPGACFAGAAFPLAPALRSTDSAASRPALFTSFAATMAESDFPRPYIIGYGSSPSRCVPAAVCCAWSDVGSPGSHATSFHTCQVLRPRRAVWALAFTRPSVLPSAFATASAPGITNLCEAQWLACVFPYRRFAAALTGDCARLGADVVSYSFIVSDLHRLLVAGLPAHCEVATQTVRHPPLWRRERALIEIKEDIRCLVPAFLT